MPIWGPDRTPIDTEVHDEGDNVVALVRIIHNSLKGFDK
jgi:hypothetical protein